MPNINALFPSRYLKAGADIEDGETAVLTLKNVQVEEVGQEGDTKPVLYFLETDKGMVLNKTNAGTIGKLYGPNTEGWVGKRVSIIATEVQFGKDMVLSLRIRSNPPKDNIAAGLKKPAAGEVSM